MQTQDARLDRLHTGVLFRHRYTPEDGERLSPRVFSSSSAFSSMAFVRQRDRLDLLADQANHPLTLLRQIDKGLDHLSLLQFCPSETIDSSGCPCSAGHAPNPKP